MKGRSSQQLAAYDLLLRELAAILTTGPMTVRELVDALTTEEGSPAAATVYARIAALEARGVEVRKMKRRRKVAGKSGQRERTYMVRA